MQTLLLGILVMLAAVAVVLILGLPLLFFVIKYADWLADKII